MSFWQLSSLAFSLKYDALDITLPWRYFTADAFRNGIIPWWNPYQLHGFAQGSSPETWYPIALLLGYWRGYSLATLNFEYLLHLLLASWGFFRLVRSLGVKNAAAYYGALVFPMTGFFVGHAQHMGWIIAGCWIPHVLASFILFNKSLAWKHGVSFVLGLFMLASGGYPGLTIVTTYIICGLAISYLSVKPKFSRSTITKQYLQLILLSVLTCAIVLGCFFQLKTSLYRGQGLHGTDSLIGSSYFKHLSSLVFPFATVKGSFEHWNADQSVINSYLGLFTLFLIGLAATQWKKFGKWIILAALPLVLSLGAELPFRQWANHLPFFDLFRFPGLFRYFFMLVFLIIAVTVIDNYSENQHVLKSYIKKVSLWSGIISLLLCSYWIFFEFETFKKISRLSVDSIHEAMVFQSFLICCLSWAMYLGLRQWPLKRILPLLMLCSAIDMGIMVQTNGRVSVFQEQPLRTYEACMQELPLGYPSPSLKDPIGTNEDKLLHFGPVYRNVNMLFKQISWDGYSPFQYSDYVSFNNSSFYDKSLGLPFAHLSYQDPMLDSLNFFISRPIISPKEKLHILKFDINQVVFEVDIPHPRLLVVNQNFLKGWKAETNEEVLPLAKVDVNLIGIKVPAGKNKVRLFFDSGQLKNTLLLSSVCFGGLCIILLLIHFPYPWIFVGLSLVSIYVFTINIPVISTNETERDLSDQLKLVMNEIDVHEQSPETRGRFLDFRDFQRFREMVRNERSPFLFQTRNLCHLEPYFTNYLERSKWIDSTREMNKRNQILVYPKMDPNSILRSFNGFEGFAKGWNRLVVNHPSESSGNRYERLENEKFSSTWIDSLSVMSSSAFKIRLSVATRSSNAENAGFVYSIMDGEEVLIWKSQPLEKNQKMDTWTKTEWRDEFSLQPGKYDIRVQIWNPAQRVLDLDDFDIVLERL